MSKHAFIVGGTGQVGLATIERFLRAGWDVTAGHRGEHPLPSHLIERGCKVAIVDRDKPAALKLALPDGADVVIDVIAYNKRHATQLLEMQGSVGAFVIISSASVYIDDLGRTLDEASSPDECPDFLVPISEGQRTVPPGKRTYSMRKVTLERTMLEKANVPVTVLRPCAIYGIGSGHPREWWFLKRALDGRKFVPIAYRGLSQFHTTSVCNIAELAYVALERRFTGILNAGDPVSPTVAEIASMIAQSVAHDWTLVPLPSVPDNSAVGMTPWSVPHPFVLNMAAAKCLGYRPVATYGEQVSALCSWLQEATQEQGWHDAFPIFAKYPQSHLFDYEAEDRVLQTMGFDIETISERAKSKITMRRSSR